MFVSFTNRKYEKLNMCPIESLLMRKQETKKNERLSNAFYGQDLQLIHQILDQQHLSLMLEHQEKHD